MQNSKSTHTKIAPPPLWPWVPAGWHHTNGTIVTRQEFYNWELKVSNDKCNYIEQNRRHQPEDSLWHQQRNCGLQHWILTELQNTISPHMLATLSVLCCTSKPSPLRSPDMVQCTRMRQTAVSGVPEDSGSCQHFCEGFGTSHRSWRSLPCMKSSGLVDSCSADEDPQVETSWFIVWHLCCENCSKNFSIHVWRNNEPLQYYKIALVQQWQQSSKCIWKTVLLLFQENGHTRLHKP